MNKYLSIMKYVISESQYAKIQVRRRIDQVKGLIKDLFAYSYPCDFDDFDSFFFSIIHGIEDELSLDWFDEDNFEFVENYIRNVLKKELEQYYQSKCKDTYSI